MPPKEDKERNDRIVKLIEEEGKTYREVVEIMGLESEGIVTGVLARRRKKKKEEEKEKRKKQRAKSRSTTKKKFEEIETDVAVLKKIAAIPTEDLDVLELIQTIREQGGEPVFKLIVTIGSMYAEAKQRKHGFYTHFKRVDFGQTKERCGEKALNDAWTFMRQAGLIVPDAMRQRMMLVLPVPL